MRHYLIPGVADDWAESGDVLLGYRWRLALQYLAPPPSPTASAAYTAASSTASGTAGMLAAKARSSGKNLFHKHDTRV